MKCKIISTLTELSLKDQRNFVGFLDFLLAVLAAMLLVEGVMRVARVRVAPTQHEFDGTDNADCMPPPDDPKPPPPAEENSSNHDSDEFNNVCEGRQHPGPGPSRQRLSVPSVAAYMEDRPSGTDDSYRMGWFFVV
jgi:hypothetical protein